MRSLAAYFLLAATGTYVAGQTLDLGFGDDDNSCDGTEIQGYCCPGSVINPSGDYMNNGNNDISGLICCVGSGGSSFNNGQKSCDSGNPVPLTEAASASGTASAGESASEAVSSATAVVTSNAASGNMSVSTGTLQATQQTGESDSGAGATTTGAEQTATATSTSVETQSETGGAAMMMATLAPALGGIALGLAGLL